MLRSGSPLYLSRSPSSQSQATACLTIVSIYSWFRALFLSLPVPIFMLLLSAIIPFANVLGLGHYLERFGSGNYQLFSELLAFLAMMDAVLMALASQQLTPDIRSCMLETSWSSMFRQKQATEIRRIQDNLHCCGLRSTHDKAWPFPNKQNGAETCEVALGRHNPCYPGWEQQQNMIMSLMIVIGALSLASKVSFGRSRIRPRSSRAKTMLIVTRAQVITLLILRFRPSWLGKPQAWHAQPGRMIAQGTIQGRSSEEPYRDEEAGNSGIRSFPAPASGEGEERPREESAWS
ncbi:MAG: hypothetical protein M1823_005921 [Watsoniomyces obsoletus]|nr:MAG: hypothetical protein M1823_005921 [Watsoniomyces obsoletus]